MIYLSHMINIVETDELEKKIQLVQRQTSYTEEQAREKLTLNDYDEMKCIREYLGVPTKKATYSTKPTSLNQQIYKEIRHKLGTVDLTKSSK
jgi:hypothetical protein